MHLWLTIELILGGRKHSFMQTPVHPSFGWVKIEEIRVEIWVDKNEEAKKTNFSKTIDIVSCASKMSVNGVNVCL